MKIIFILQVILAYSSAQLLTFEKGGNVGVNFAGFSAGAGLGGLLTQNGADGGLHAHAGTPYGQNAAAGLGGRIEDDGTSTGGLYAGAQASGAAVASANVDVVKVQNVQPVVAVPVHKYVEKRVQVVPATNVAVEKHVQVVPAANVAVEKHVQVVPAPKVAVEKRIVLDTRIQTPKTVIVEEAPKTEIYVRRPIHRRKYAYINARLNAREGPPPRVLKVTNVDKVKSVEVEARPATTYVSSVAVNKNGNLFNDIFNIPISTLRAVNQLVNNIVGGTSVSVSKHVSASAAASGNVDVNKHYA